MASPLSRRVAALEATHGPASRKPHILLIPASVPEHAWDTWIEANRPHGRRCIAIYTGVSRDDDPIWPETVH